jgi:pseudouridine-5'-phosphate glycosidase
LTVVCSGAKIILDLPATREWLETNGVCVLGYGCEEFPAFYSAISGLKVDERIETPAQAAQIIRARNVLNLPGSILVTVPVPPKFEIDSIELEGILSEALKLAEKENIRGKDTTPFLLGRMSQKSEGKTSLPILRCWKTMQKSPLKSPLPYNL